MHFLSYDRASDSRSERLFLPSSGAGVSSKSEAHPKRCPLHRGAPRLQVVDAALSRISTAVDADVILFEDHAVTQGRAQSRRRCEEPASTLRVPVDEQSKLPARMVWQSSADPFLFVRGCSGVSQDLDMCLPEAMAAIQNR
jgi:hypothetical protein